MKIRNSEAHQENAELNMTSMIDIVFQLLIFFMLTLKIVEPEGDFNINMPAQGQPTSSDEIPLPDIKVKLRANPDGTLAGLFFGSRNLGVGPGAFEQLNTEILKLIGRPGDPITKDMAVEIDADYDLHFSNVINAVGACTGRVDKRSGNIVKYIEKIKFKPPTSPTAAG